MATTKIGAECCNNCIHWGCRTRRTVGSPPSEVETTFDSEKCSISHDLTEWRDCCGMFKHIRGVTNTFRPDRDNMLNPGEAYLKSVMNSIEARRQRQVEENIQHRKEESSIQTQETDDKCFRCHGLGMITCFKCDGSGKGTPCSNCDGKGGFSVSVQIKEMAKSYSRRTAWILRANIDDNFWKEGWDWDKDPNEIKKFGRQHVVCSKTCQLEVSDSPKRKVQNVLKIAPDSGDFLLSDGLSEEEKKTTVESYTNTFNTYMKRCKDIEEEAQKWGADWLLQKERIKKASLSIVDTPCIVQTRFKDRFGFQRTAIINLAAKKVYLKDTIDGMNPDASAKAKEQFKELFQKAEGGDAEAQYDLGIAFYHGYDGAIKDVNAAVLWLEKATANGFTAAVNRCEEIKNEITKKNGGTFVFGDHHFSESTGEIEKEKCRKIFQAANEGVPNAQYEMGNVFAKGMYGVIIDWDKACDWYLEAAEKDFVDAQYELALCYYKGQGVCENNEKAVEWFLKVAQHGRPEGQYMLGICYYNGYGVEKDEIEAIKWFTKSAEQDYSKAQCKLGDCYRLGKGEFEKSDEQALEWYKKSADRENATAEYWMAVFYEDGRGGLQKDMQTSFEWRFKSANHGDSDAMNGVGWAYQQGRGTAKDATEAVKWYRKAIEKGNRASMNNLAKCYEDGIGVEVDLSEAFKLFKQSAEKGFSRGCYHLGRFYENGLGCAKNIDEAKEWYQKAADKGDKDAKAALERLG